MKKKMLPVLVVLLFAGSQAWGMEKKEMRSKYFLDSLIEVIEEENNPDAKFFKDVLSLYKDFSGQVKEDLKGMEGLRVNEKITDPFYALWDFNKEFKKAFEEKVEPISQEEERDNFLREFSESYSPLQTLFEEKDELISERIKKLKEEEEAKEKITREYIRENMLKIEDALNRREKKEEILKKIDDYLEEI